MPQTALPPRPQPPSFFTARRWRITLLVVCLLLGWLGVEDLRVALANRLPQAIAPEEVGPLRDWLEIGPVRLDLPGAISSSGNVELEALLVPLMPISHGDDRSIAGAPLVPPSSEQAAHPVRFLLETRDTRRLELFQRYHFALDSDSERAAFLSSHRKELLPLETVRGLVMSGSVAKANRDKLMKLAQESGMRLDPDVKILVEGRTPSPWRGLGFALVALAGLFRTAWMFRKKPADAVPGGIS